MLTHTVPTFTCVFPRHWQWTRALGAVTQSLQSHAALHAQAQAPASNSSQDALQPVAALASSSGRPTAAQLCAQLTELFAALPDADVTDLKQTEQVDY